MPTTRRQHQKQNVLFCFSNSVSLLMQINQGDAEVYLRRLYPVATKIIYLPESFSSVAKFLSHKPNGGSYFQNVIKDALAAYWSNHHVGYEDLATKQFPTHRSVVDWCINRIVEDYIAKTSKLMTRRKPKACYLSWCNDAKVRWSQKRNDRLREEAYLASDDFYWELNRSVAEFNEELKKVIGCTPFSWRSVM